MNNEKKGKHWLDEDTSTMMHLYSMRVVLDDIVSILGRTKPSIKRRRMLIGFTHLPNRCHYSDEYKIKKSNQLREWWENNPDAKDYISNINKGRKCSEQFKEEQSVRMTKNNPMNIEEYRQKVSLAKIGHKQSKETKEKISLTAKNNWLNKEFVRRWANSVNLKPNKLEIIAHKLIDRLFLNKYRYVGDGYTFIGRKNPDFIDFKDRKIIEIYGDYWHRDEKENNGINRINHFKKYGYETLIVWEHEFDNINILTERLISFNLGGT